MPKKDTASAVIGMLSTAGAATRIPPEEPAPAEMPVAASAVTVTETVQSSVSPFPVPPRVMAPTTTAPDAPRTLRLRPATALRLREAWLEAKRDDVLLTAQDFASDLVDEALQDRRRLPSGTSS